jgi:hypothetical protein
MAYAGAVTTFPALVAGVTPKRGQIFQVSIAETEGAASSEATIDLGERCIVRVLRADLTKTAGTAATFNPRIGPTTAPTGYSGGFLWLNAAAASPISNEGAIGSVCVTDSAGKLYHRSTPDAGADNTVTVTYVFEVL